MTNHAYVGASFPTNLEAAILDLGHYGPTREAVESGDGVTEAIASHDKFICPHWRCVEWRARR